MSAISQRFIRQNKNDHEDTARTTSHTGHVTAGGNETVVAGGLEYVGEQGGNDAPLAYQEASGAPVETKSPLGYSVGPVTIIFLNISKM